MKPNALVSAALALWVGAAAAGAAAARAADIRQPVRAGSFYPAEPGALSQVIEAFILRARASPAEIPSTGSLRALILPHAGYPYSGPTAAYGSLALSGRRFAKVLLMGPDHFLGIRNAAVPDARFFQTPLGRVPVHAAARSLMQRTDLFQALPVDADREHSLEVVLPFLQRDLKDFELIPLVVGPVDPAALAAALMPALDADTLVVVSSDLSHYLAYPQAVAKDRRTIDAILSLDHRALAAENSACGAAAIRVLLTLAAALDWHPILLNYQNSGDTAGDRSRVVGYAAVAFFGDPPMTGTKNSHAPLEPEKGHALVALARSTLMERFGRRLPAAEAETLQQAMSDAALQARCGTFVTLKLKGELRGCIGNLNATEALAEGVRRNAVSAAFHDPRFAPLSESELDQVQIEVSVLTEPKPLAFADADDLLRKLRPKVDGVIIRKGPASATFLPQVWEQLSRPEDFLSHLCLKAGLPRDEWRRGRLEVSTYQVQYFEENR
jgi:AmmeMemoRadiSam system protein B/AmmeMemoRadiSam system protein A